jgi:hypothetical protein
MPTPTPRQLRDPAFTKALMDCINSQPLKFYTPIMDLLKRPNFRRTREVHAARARKLRRRGEYVHFLRWEHGHCIYGWSGPAPQTITLHRMPRKKSAEPVYVQVEYKTSWVLSV